MKRLFHLLLVVLAAICWMAFMEKGREVEKLQADLSELYEVGAEDSKVIAMEDEINGAKGERIFTGLLLTILTAGVIGIFIVVYLLPFFAQKVTHAVYDSGEMVEKDKMREAHSLVAQGEYERAIDAFKRVADEDPLNRLPWVEISKVYRHHLHQSQQAADTLREALESHEWQVGDAAFLMFRIAEIHDEDLENRPTARLIMQQVIDDFPETRHSANAAHKLRDWDHEEEEAARHAEEQKFIVRQQQGGAAPAGNPDNPNA